MWLQPSHLSGLWLPKACLHPLSAHPHVRAHLLTVHTHFKVQTNRESLWIIHLLDITGHPVRVSSYCPFIFSVASVASGSVLAYTVFTHVFARWAAEVTRLCICLAPSATVVTMFTQGHSYHCQIYSALAKNSLTCVLSMIILHIIWHTHTHTEKIHA